MTTRGRRSRASVWRRSSYLNLQWVDHRSVRVFEILDVAGDKDQIAVAAISPSISPGGRIAAIRPHSTEISSVTGRMRSV